MQQAGDGSAGVEQRMDLLPDGSVIGREQRRSSGLEEVDITVAVDIGQIGAVSTRDCQRERIVESEIVLHAAGNNFLSSFRKMPGLHAPFLEILEHLLHVFPANGT